MWKHSANHALLRRAAPCVWGEQAVPATSSRARLELRVDFPFMSSAWLGVSLRQIPNKDALCTPPNLFDGAMACLVLAVDKAIERTAANGESV